MMRVLPNCPQGCNCNSFLRPRPIATSSAEEEHYSVPAALTSDSSRSTGFVVQIS